MHVLGSTKSVTTCHRGFGHCGLYPDFDTGLADGFQLRSICYLHNRYHGSQLGTVPVLASSTVPYHLRLASWFSVQYRFFALNRQHSGGIFQVFDYDCNFRFSCSLSTFIQLTPPAFRFYANIQQVYFLSIFTPYTHTSLVFSINK